jgi:putative membrane protein
MTKLATGSKKLSDKTTKGYNDLSGSLKNDSKTMATAFSEPVVMDQKAIDPVKTYGEGFTPYFIPLSLWVGALMMFFVITDKVDDDIAAGPASVVAGKFLSYGAIGFMQAVLASGAVMLLGLRPDNILLYFLFNIFLSYVFIAIIQCMVFLLGQLGRLISIVLLILQLTSCAGTFPIEIVPNLFKVLNPFMPFTYAVSGLREVISGINYGVFTKDVIVLAGMLLIFLVTSVLMKGHADKAQKYIKEKKAQADNVTA